MSSNFVPTDSNTIRRSPLAQPGGGGQHARGSMPANQGQDDGPGKSPAERQQQAEGMHHGGSFGAYMANKNRKLQEQFAEQRSVLASNATDPLLARLFSGVCIHVNGFTNPTHQELKHLMAMHGGRFEVYYHRAVVTHIICSHLPDAKVKLYEKERNPTPVVRPEWIVESIKAKRLLPHEGFILWRLRGPPGQQRLVAFKPAQPAALPASHFRESGTTMGSYSFASPLGIANSKSVAAAGGSPVPPAALPPPSSLSHPARQLTFDSLLPQPLVSEALGSADAAACAPPGRTNCTPQAAAAPARAPPATPAVAGQDSRASAPAADAAAPAAAPAVPAQPLPPAAVTNAGPPPAATAAAAAPAAMGLRAAAPRCGATVDDDAGLAAAQAHAAAERAACEVLRGMPRSTLDDPNFMETYYKSSRLHFIGRWKARIEELAAQLASDAPSPQYPAPPTLTAFLAGHRGAGGGLRSAAVDRTIIHIDMDCFFASIATLSNPAFKGRPLAVCHSNSSKGTAEVSSANYEARAYGVRASMFMGEAKRLCPHLVVMPYQFDKYAAASEAAFSAMWRVTSAVQPVSCDEAYLDVTGLGDPDRIAAELRADIEAATGCTASAGIGPNILLAKLATSRAKPNGQFRIAPNDADMFLLRLPVGDLPGVGWSKRQQLHALGVHSVADLRSQGKEALRRELGDKLGAQLWRHAHGRDERPVEPPKARKSVGAEVNYGMRFDAPEQPFKFLEGLAAEVSSRMRQSGVRGKHITLKLMRRKAGAPEPPKFLGHGSCDSLSRSRTLSRFVDSPAELARYAKDLLRDLGVQADQIRGMGITVAKLDNDPASVSARPNAPPIAKLPAPPPSAFEPVSEWDHVYLRAAQQPAGEGQQQREQQGGVRGGGDASPSASHQPARSCSDMVAPAAAASAAVLSRAGGSEPAAPQLQRLDHAPDQGASSAADRPLGGDCASRAGSASPRPDGCAIGGSTGAWQAPALALQQAAGTGLRGMAGSSSAADAAAVAAVGELTLSQIDPATLAELPPHLQREVVEQLRGSRVAALRTRACAAQAAALPAASPPPLGSKGKAPMCEQGAAEGDGGVCGPPPAAVRCGGRGAATTTPMPSASQIDVSVLAQLPAEERREIERWMGLAPLHRSPPKPAAPRKRSADAAPVRPGKRKQQLRLPAFAAQPARGPAADITLSQVDPEVLARLPVELQRELVQQLAATRATTHHAAPPRPHSSAGGAAASAAAALPRAHSMSGAGAADRHDVPWQMVEAIVAPRRQQLDCAGGRREEQEEELGVGAMQQWRQELVSMYGDNVATLLHVCVSQLMADAEQGVEVEVETAHEGFEAWGRELLQEQLRGLGQVTVAYALQRIDSDMEGVTRLLQSVERLRARWPPFAQAAAEVINAVQAAAQERYGGRLLLPNIE